MSIKTYSPTTPGRRQMTVSGFDGVDKHARPEKSLTEVLKKNAGRNSYGRITVRHQGGGNRQKYRVIDFKRDKMEMTAKVTRIEYDPNRSAYIALCEYEDGELRYILAPVGLNVGDTIQSSAAADIKPGNCAAACKHPRGHRSSTTSSSTPARALSSSVPPAAPRSSWPRKTAGSPCVFPPASSARSAWTARPLSDRSATSTTPTSIWARPAANATWASARPSAALL
jgi:hypothetical protein